MSSPSITVSRCSRSSPGRSPDRRRSPRQGEPSFTPSHVAFHTEPRRRLGDAAGTRGMVEVLLLHRTYPMAPSSPASTATDSFVAIEETLRRSAVPPRTLMDTTNYLKGTIRFRPVDLPF